ncbi:MAG: hypothetical protein KC466_05870 [Myxococcales bacterium]|nr:hypothetical protein [Myxococcales bacterium]
MLGSGDRTTQALLVVVAVLLIANLALSRGRTASAQAEDPPIFGNPSHQREQMIAELRGLREEVAHLRTSLRETPLPVEVVKRER